MQVAVRLFLLAALTGQHTATEPAGHKHGSVVVEEGSDVILPCSFHAEFKVFDWKKNRQQEVFLHDGDKHYNDGRNGQDEQFRGRVSHFEDELRHGNASIKITNTKVEDSGDYTCIIPNLEPHQEFHVKLVVRPVLRDRSGEVRGASPEPYIKTHFTDDSVQLQCEVRRASPQPKLKWLDSDGHDLPAEEPQVSERGGRYNIALRALVTKPGRYRCVLTQEDINHGTEADTTLPAKLFDTCSKQAVTGWLGGWHGGWLGGWLGGFCLGVITSGVALALLVARKFITIHRNNGSSHDNRDNGL